MSSFSDFQESLNERKLRSVKRENAIKRTFPKVRNTRAVSYRSHDLARDVLLKIDNLNFQLGRPSASGPAITDVPAEMTMDVYSSIMYFMHRNKIPAEQFAQVIQSTRISAVWSETNNITKNHKKTQKTTKNYFFIFIFIFIFIFNNFLGFFQLKNKFWQKLKNKLYYKE